MSTPKRKSNHLPPLQKRIILYLAKHEPQTINETDKEVHKPQHTHTYKASWTAFNSLRKKGLINKVDVKTHHNIEYPRFWLSPLGIYTALVEGANPQHLREKTVKTYPDDKNLQLFLEMAPFTGIEVYRIALSAILSKGKLEQSDMTTIILTLAQRNQSTEQSNQFLRVLRGHPEEYEKVTRQIKQLAELLEKKGEIANSTA